MHADHEPPATLASLAKEIDTLKNELALARRTVHEKASALTTAEVRIVDAYRELDRLRATIRERTAERDAALAQVAELQQRPTI